LHNPIIHVSLSDQAAKEFNYRLYIPAKFHPISEEKQVV
jgi:hypothetical protein